MPNNNAQMTSAKVSVKIHSGRSHSSFTAQSNAPGAIKPATPLQTLIASVAYIAHVAELYEGAGDNLLHEVSMAIENARKHAATVPA
jgi:hypothetical protein